jgi:hypothetical protein
MAANHRSCGWDGGMAASRALGALGHIPGHPDLAAFDANIGGRPLMPWSVVWHQRASINNYLFMDIFSRDQYAQQT